MEEYQKRVVAEKFDLDAKIAALMQFGSSQIFASLPVEEQRRLRMQHRAMTDYSWILGERIAAFNL